MCKPSIAFHDCEIVALCDRELLMAKQLGERFGVTRVSPICRKCCKRLAGCRSHYDSAQSHYSLAKAMSRTREAMFMLEKPFTITAGEAESLIQLAEGRGLRATVGHNYQFTLEMLEMRRLVREGFLGGKPVHLESYWSYDFGRLKVCERILEQPHPLGAPIAGPIASEHHQPRDS